VSSGHRAIEGAAGAARHGSSAHDCAGIDMPHGPRRIVCLTEEPTEVLYALGEQDRIVGISGFPVRPPRARK
jgi:ABC-type hemin transport system substrate-binding protein